MSRKWSRVLAVVCVGAIASTTAMERFVSGQTGKAVEDNPASDSAAKSTIAVAATDDAHGSAESARESGSLVGASVSVAAETTSDRRNGPRFKAYPDDAEPIERWMYAMLDQPVTLNYSGPDVPLKDVLADIEDQISEAHGATDDGENFRLMFWPDYGELALDLDPNDPLAEVQIVKITVRGMKLRSALKLVFEQVVEPIELTYVILDEVMLVTSVDRAKSADMLFTRVYDVGELLDVKKWKCARDSTAVYGMAAFSVTDGPDGETTQEKSDDSGSIESPSLEQADGVGASAPDCELYSEPALIDIVHYLTAPPNSWVGWGDEFGDFTLYGRLLAVRQTHAGHQEVVQLLNQLSEAGSSLIALSSVTGLEGSVQESGPRFKAYPDDAEPIERWMYAMLDQRVDLNYPGPNVPLKDVLRDIENQISDAHGASDEGEEFRLTFWPDYAELRDDLDSNDPLAEIQIARIAVRGMKLRSVLKLIFDQVVEPVELTYVIQDEVMLVTSVDREHSEELLFTRVYEVGEMLDVKRWTDVDKSNNTDAAGTSTKGGSGFFSVVADRVRDSADDESGGVRVGKGRILTQICGTMQYVPDPVPHLSDVMLSMTAPPNFWIDNGDEFGDMQVFERSLVVRQTHKGHRAVVRVLNQLSEAMKRWN